MSGTARMMMPWQGHGDDGEDVFQGDEYAYVLATRRMVEVFQLPEEIEGCPVRTTLILLLIEEWRARLRREQEALFSWVADHPGDALRGWTA